MEEKQKSLAGKIIAIQSDLSTNVEKTVKKSENKGLQYDYSKESDVLAVIKPLLKKYNIGYLTSHGKEYHLDRIVEQKTRWDYKEKKSIVYNSVEWTYSSMGTFALIDGDSDNTFTVDAPFVASNTDSAKAVGAADTYGVKYGLKKIFGLPDDELDPDNEQGQEKAPETTKTPSNQAINKPKEQLNVEPIIKAYNDPELKSKMITEKANRLFMLANDNKILNMDLATLKHFSEDRVKEALKDLKELGDNNE